MRKFNQILICDPEGVDDFYPFSIMHPIYEIRCGIYRIFEKYEKQYSELEIYYYSKNQNILNSFLKRFNKIQDETELSGSILIFNSKNLPNVPQFLEIESCIENNNENLIFYIDDTPIAFYLKDSPKLIFDDFEKIIMNLQYKKINLEHGNIINYIWDAIYLNAESIESDMWFNEEFNPIVISSNYHTVNPDSIFLGENVSIAAGVVIDANEGPVIIDDNVKIMANSVLIGPVYIGRNTIVKVGAKIYEKTSIGEYCKVGGEIENSIIQAFSNKQHDGFLGHSFISEWVNIGADTNTSDLKNTYSEISVSLRNTIIDTGKMFLGLICGDHTKTAINTQFNTGTICGIGAILFKEGFLHTSIPSFSWGGKKDSPIFKSDKAISIAKIVMARRNRKLNEYEIELINSEFTLTNKNK